MFDCLIREITWTQYGMVVSYFLTLLVLKNLIVVIVVVNVVGAVVAQIWIKHGQKWVFGPKCRVCRLCSLKLYIS